jgi:uncharacterized membrane protein YqiK
MAIDKTAVQKELDLAAHELEKAGHKDLADKVDYFGDRLMRATAGEVPLVRRALSRVLDEAKRRMRAAEPKDDARVEKAKHATTQARRVSAVKKEVLRRRLLEIASKRKAAMKRLESLREGRQERSSAESLRENRRQRIAKDRD